MSAASPTTPPVDISAEAVSEFRARVTRSLGACDLCDDIHDMLRALRKALTAAESDRSGFAATVAQMERELREARGRERELVSALWTLKNEIGGLDAFECEMREVISNTNWECLKKRAADARDLFARMGLSDDECRVIYRALLSRTTGEGA